MTLSEELTAWATEQGLDHAAAALAAYWRELELWNPRLGLLEATGREILVKHFYDCLAPWTVFRKLAVPGARCADIGSGAGFPGIPLALALPDTHWTLVEKQGRRCGFLLNARAMTGLKERLEVRQERLEDQPASTWDLVTCRAFTPLAPESLAALRRVVRPGGLLVLYKARRERIGEELATCGLEAVVMDGGVAGSPRTGGGAGPAGAGARGAIPPHQAWIVPVQVPGMDEERHLVVIGDGQGKD